MANHFRHINYYGVTFDHLVPAGDPDPDVLQINIIELETDDGPFTHGEAYANEYLLFAVDPADYRGKKVLAVPRCCQKRKGTQDRARVNSSVAERDARMKGTNASKACSVCPRPEDSVPLECATK
jgi:hypothetical protein